MMEHKRMMTKWTLEMKYLGKIDAVTKNMDSTINATEVTLSMVEELDKVFDQFLHDDDDTDKVNVTLSNDAGEVYNADIDVTLNVCREYSYSVRDIQKKLSNDETMGRHPDQMQLEDVIGGHNV